MNSQPNFLHIPDGDAVTVTLKFSTGLERTGQFGKYFIYGVMHEGKDKLLKVTERLEKQLRKADVQAGQEIQLRKDAITPKQGEPYSVVNLVPGNVPDPVPVDLAQSTSHSAESADELRILTDALTDARTICKYANEPSIIPEITLAVGLFLARTIRIAMTTGATNHRTKRSTRRMHKATNGEDKPPVGNLEKKEGDLPF